MESVEKYTLDVRCGALHPFPTGIWILAGFWKDYRDRMQFFSGYVLMEEKLMNSEMVFARHLQYGTGELSEKLTLWKG